jgi:hypothetical protein
MEILPSEWKLLNDKLTQLKNEKESIRAQTLRELNAKILRTKWLDSEMKSKLLDLIWDKHED